MRILLVTLALAIGTSCVVAKSKRGSDDKIARACARPQSGLVDVEFEVELIARCMSVKHAECTATVVDGVLHIAGEVRWIEWTTTYCETDGEFNPDASCALPAGAEALPVSLSGGPAQAPVECPYS